MASSPTLFDVNRISVVEKYVTVLDRIPDRYTGAAYVFLSKNNLTSLQGALSATMHLHTAVPDLPFVCRGGTICRCEGAFCCKQLHS